ncbi:hypothetical protein CPB97_005974, partial [Podila verticillata]
MTQTRATTYSIENPLSAEELQAELDDGGHLFWLYAIPTWPRIDQDPTGKPEVTLDDHAMLMAQVEQDPIPSPPVKFVSTSYGFHLEAPRCCDILTDTPCRLLPGLEEHSIMIGDTPEAEENMDRLFAMFSEHKDCFPLPGEMSRTMDASKIDEPAHFFLKPGMPLPKARPKKFSIPEAKAALSYRASMVAAGKMRKSSSPVSSNPVFVAKKDGTLRFVVNFIPVNRLIAPCAWPIPDPMTEISKLQGCDWMSCWD